MCYGSMIQESMQRARKAHVCSLCDRTIRVGREYSRAVAKDEGELYVQKTCKRCLALLEVSDAADTEGCLFSGWREEVKSQLKGFGFAALMKKMRDAIALRRRIWEMNRAERKPR